MAKALKVIAVVASVVAIVASAGALLAGEALFLGLSAGTFTAIAAGASVPATGAAIAFQRLARPPPNRGGNPHPALQDWKTP